VRKNVSKIASGYSVSGGTDQGDLKHNSIAKAAASGMEKITLLPVTTKVPVHSFASIGLCSYFHNLDTLP
jgi:hypothetical protein